MVRKGSASWINKGGREEGGARGERRQDELVCEKKLREVESDNKGVWEE